MNEENTGLMEQKTVGKKISDFAKRNKYSILMGLGIVATAAVTVAIGVVGSMNAGDELDAVIDMDVDVTQ